MMIWFSCFNHSRYLCILSSLLLCFLSSFLLCSPRFCCDSFSILPGKGTSGARHEQDILAELRKSAYATSFELKSISGPLGLLSGLKEVEEEEEYEGELRLEGLRVDEKGLDKGLDKGLTTSSTSTSIDRAAYAYLLDLPLRSLTEERALALRRKYSHSVGILSLTTPLHTYPPLAHAVSVFTPFLLLLTLTLTLIFACQNPNLRFLFFSPSFSRR